MQATWAGGRYENPMSESTLTPSQGFINSATASGGGGGEATHTHSLAGPVTIKAKTTVHWSPGSSMEVREPAVWSQFSRPSNCGVIFTITQYNSHG